MAAYDWRNDPNVTVNLSPDQIAALQQAQPWQGSGALETPTIPGAGGGGGAFVSQNSGRIERPALPPGQQGIVPAVPGGGGPALSPAGNSAQQVGPAMTPSPDQSAGGAQAPQGQGTPDWNQIIYGPNSQKIADDVTERTKKANAEAKKKVAETDFDWEGAWKELEEKFGSKIELPNLKSKEEKGLWMMDFGFRMMAAAGSNNFFTSAGMAGVGANQAQQQRVQAQRELAVQDRRAGERLAMTGLGQQAQIHQQNMENRRGDIIATEEGYVRVLPDGSTKMLTGEDGGPLKPFDRSGKHGGKYAAELQLEWLQQAGYSFRESVDIMNGAATPAELEQAAGKAADAAWEGVLRSGQLVTPPGASKPKLPSQWSDQEISTYKANRKRESMALYGAVGAQSGSGALGTPPPDSARPPNKWGIAPGTVEGDYEYVDGDPSLQSSWKKRGT